MKKKLVIIVLLFAVVAAAVYYFWLRPGKKSHDISFTTAKAEYGYIAKSITATGTIQPVDTVSVGAQVSGVVKNVYADFNDPVKPNQLLAKVDPSIINEQVNQAKATLANVQSNLEYQQKNYDRQTELFALGAISKADYQAAVNQYQAAKASVNNATAQLKLADRNLYYTNIYSPINGVVLNRNISAGQTIASTFNAPTLFVIAKDLTKMLVNANVDEADIGGIKIGLNVTFTVDAFPDETFYGTVQNIRLHPSVSSNVVTYTTLVSVENKNMKLKPGMTASIVVYTREDSNALLIPAKAINFKPGEDLLKKYFIEKAMANTPQTGEYGKRKKLQANDSSRVEEDTQKSFVWIKNGDTLIEKRIFTGMSDGNNVRVIKGLSFNDEVITGIQTGKYIATGNSQRSPFIPQMPSRQRSTNR